MPLRELVSSIGEAAHFLRLDNPISGTVVTSIKIRTPTPLRDNDHDDDDRNNDR